MLSVIFLLLIAALDSDSWHVRQHATMMLTACPQCHHMLHAAKCSPEASKRRDMIAKKWVPKSGKKTPVDLTSYADATDYIDQQKHAIPNPAVTIARPTKDGGVITLPAKNKTGGSPLRK